MNTTNKYLYDALIEAGASEASAVAAASHYVISELGAIRTELKWMKLAKLQCCSAAIPQPAPHVGAFFRLEIAHA